MAVPAPAAAGAPVNLPAGAVAATVSHFGREGHDTQDLGVADGRCQAVQGHDVLATEEDLQMGEGARRRRCAERRPGPVFVFGRRRPRPPCPRSPSLLRRRRPGAQDNGIWTLTTGDSIMMNLLGALCRFDRTRPGRFLKNGAAAPFLSPDGLYCFFWASRRNLT